MRRRFWSWLILLVSGCVHWGCPSDDLINTAARQWRLLAVIADGAHSRLALYAMPSGSLLQEDVYAAANGQMLDGTVERIEQFRSMLFLLQPDRQRIEVLDASSFKQIARIETAPHPPRAICFANGTTAYTANDDSTVGVVDLTVFRVVRILTVGKTPVSIAAMGNQVAVCNREDGTVSIIDTRTNAVTTTVPMPPVPAFVVGGADPATSFCIVSVGTGKLDNTQPPGPAMLTFYDPFAQRVSAQLEVRQLVRDATETLPWALIGTPVATAFLVLDDEVQLIDIAGQRVLGAIVTGSFHGGTYNFTRDVVAIWGSGEGGTTVVALDPASGSEQGRTTLPIVFRTAAGL